jgi:hypothetical protein
LNFGKKTLKDWIYQLTRWESRHFSLNWAGSQLWSREMVSCLSYYQKDYPYIYNLAMI